VYLKKSMQPVFSVVGLFHCTVSSASHAAEAGSAQQLAQQGITQVSSMAISTRESRKKQQTVRTRLSRLHISSLLRV
jgi:ABC-type transporter MlaC component